MALGELHGRKLDSALMWGRVHNRTSDRGGKPIRLAWPWAQPPVHPEDRGPFAMYRALKPEGSAHATTGLALGLSGMLMKDRR
jgi:hypothetical protein